MASDLFHPYLLGGGERRMYEIARRLARRHEVHVLTRRFRGLPSYELHEGVHIHRVFVPSGRIKLESPTDGLVFTAGTLLKGMRPDDFDVYAPQQFFPIPPLWLSACAREKIIVPTIHDVYRETWTQKYGLKGVLMSLFEKIILRLPYSKVITVSNSTKRKLMRELPEEKIEVIPNGVDLKLYEGPAKKASRPRIVYVGRLVGYKHVDDLLLAFSKLPAESQLFVVGDGPEMGRLRSLSEKLGLGKRVVFTGFVKEEEKISILKSSHVLVLPSSTEGFGIVVLEAWASGTIPVVSNIPALTELVQDGESGMVFRLHDVSQLTQKLKQVLEEDSLREELVKEGEKRVRNFDWEIIAKKHEEIFKSLLG